MPISAKCARLLGVAVVPSSRAGQLLADGKIKEAEAAVRQALKEENRAPVQQVAR